MHAHNNKARRKAICSLEQAQPWLWRVVALQRRQANKFRTLAMTYAAFQLEVLRAGREAETRRAAEFEGFLAWARASVPAAEMGSVATPVLAEAPRLELSDVLDWGPPFKTQLAALAARYAGYLEEQRAKSEAARRDGEEQARRRAEIELARRRAKEGEEAERATAELESSIRDLQGIVANLGAGGGSKPSSPAPPQDAPTRREPGGAPSLVASTRAAQSEHYAQERQERQTRLQKLYAELNKT